MMKKKMFLVFMAFAALAMTGCSNDDNATEQPNVPERQAPSPASWPTSPPTCPD